MTPEEFTHRLPPLSNNPLPAKPPFVFNGLSSRVLPLRANLDALQRFVNTYLNFVPESVGRFRAAVPYVFLSVLDYGQVAESGGLGWFVSGGVYGRIGQTANLGLGVRWSQAHVKSGSFEADAGGMVYAVSLGFGIPPYDDPPGN